MRPLDDWDETDLAALIADEVQEGLRLDYKQSEALARTEKSKAELAKDVSAFANSAGGRIIYGVKERDQLPVSIDSGSDQSVISREWLEQVINSRISPRISGITIKSIPLAVGGTAYVIDIVQATTFAPHQANHRYYRRFNFESVPMEDYEVKDAMRRAAVGDPYVRFEWIKSTPADDGSERAQLSVYAGNQSSEPIIYANLQIYIDSRIALPDKIDGWEIKSRNSFHIGERLIGVTTLIRNALPSNHMPFFKESEWTMIEVTAPLPPSDDYIFGYKFVAPGVTRQRAGLLHIDGHQITAAFPEGSDLLNPLNVSSPKA